MKTLGVINGNAAPLDLRALTETPGAEMGIGDDGKAYGRVLLKHIEILNDGLKIAPSIEALLVVCYQSHGYLTVKVRFHDPSIRRVYREVEFLEVLWPTMIPPVHRIGLQDLMQAASDAGEKPLAIICCAIARALEPEACLTIKTCLGSDERPVATFSLFINFHSPELYQPEDVERPLEEFSGFLVG